MNANELGAQSVAGRYLGHDGFTRDLGGLTKRELAFFMAMQGILANPGAGESAAMISRETGCSETTAISTLARLHAEAILNELAKEQP